MHKNRTVEFKGVKIAIDKINALRLKGRQMAKTVVVKWHDMLLHITAAKRIDRHLNESIIYQAATFVAKPSKHAAIYKKRWPIEKFFRTAKQHLGLQDCFSTRLETQLDHFSSVLLAY